MHCKVVFVPVAKHKGLSAFKTCTALKKGQQVVLATYARINIQSGEYVLRVNHSGIIYHGTLEKHSRYTR